MDQVKFFKIYLPQILLDPFLNTLFHLFVGYFSSFMKWINFRKITILRHFGKWNMIWQIWSGLFSANKQKISFFVGNKAKGRISKRVLQENKARQIFRKTNISYPLIRFSENLACFVFLKHPFWDSPFYLITDDMLNCFK